MHIWKMSSLYSYIWLIVWLHKFSTLEIIFFLGIFNTFNHCLLSFNFAFEKSNAILIPNFLWQVSFFSSLDICSIFSLAMVFWKLTIICWMNGHFQSENLWPLCLEFLSMSIFYLIITSPLLFDLFIFSFWKFYYLYF